MLAKKVVKLETELKAAQLAAPTNNQVKRKANSRFPAIDPAHPEIFSGPGHAEKGGVTRFGQPYKAGDEPATSHSQLFCMYCGCLMHLYLWCTNHDKPYASQCPDPVKFKALKDAWQTNPLNTHK